MIRFVFRFFGLWILAAGFVALVRDGTKSIAGNAIFITRLGEDWNNLHAASQDALNALVVRYAGPAAWELATLYLLRLGVGGEWVGPLLWPAVGVHGILSLLLARQWRLGSTGH